MEFNMEVKKISRVKAENEEYVRIILKGNLNYDEIKARLELTITKDAFNSTGKEYMLDHINNAIDMVLKQKQTRLGE